MFVVTADSKISRTLFRLLMSFLYQNYHRHYQVCQNYRFPLALLSSCNQPFEPTTVVYKATYMISMDAD